MYEEWEGILNRRKAEITVTASTLVSLYLTNKDMFKQKIYIVKQSVDALDYANILSEVKEISGDNLYKEMNEGGYLWI